VPSRRLGLSLGIDLVPVKTCPFDCPFCEVGATTCHTITRRDYVPVKAVLAELDAWLARGGVADIITVAGSGEPTLHTGCGTILAGIAARCNIPTALLTNSALMHLPEVRADAARASIVKVSLSAWDQASFERVNRAHCALRFDQMVEGLRTLRAEYAGQIWLEVFVMAGVNDAPADVARIATLAASMAPNRVQLNTVVRPPAHRGAQAVTEATLADLANLFEPRAEIIARFESATAAMSPGSDGDIVNMVARRPCTAADIAASFGLSDDAAQRVIEGLLASDRINAETRADGVYYLAKAGPVA